MEDVSITTRRIERVGERLLPRLEVLHVAEVDLGEKVLSGARDP